MLFFFINPPPICKWHSGRSLHSPRPSYNPGLDWREVYEQKIATRIDLKDLTEEFKTVVLDLLKAAVSYIVINFFVAFFMKNL